MRLRRIVVGVLAAGFAAIVLPHAAAAQCEGGVTVTGLYARDGSYVPTHCAYTNPTTPGQLYPSGAEPVPSTNPAQGASRLPGQVYPSGLLPVNSSDLGPAPSYVNMNGLQGSGVTNLGPTVGPGSPVAPDTSGVIAPATGATPGNVVPGQVAANGVNNVGVGTNTAVTNNSLLPGQVNSVATATGMPGQSPQTGLPALNDNRAVPSVLTNGATTTTGALTGTGAALRAAGAVNPATGAVGATNGTLTPATSAVAAPGTAATGLNLSLMNTAYGVSLPAAPPRAEQTFTSEQTNTVTVAFPGQ
ncbi:MAG TPA: hypothetical protein VII06_04380 [Chloroflexota bacterium]|jgi:hypothetical protein